MGFRRPLSTAPQANDIQSFVGVLGEMEIEGKGRIASFRCKCKISTFLVFRQPSR